MNPTPTTKNTAKHETESLRDYLWKRQYAVHPDESSSEGFRRVATNITDDPSDRAAYLELMDDNRFVPGGRILAGAGTPHGNLLNCFVQDGNPEPPGSTAWALELALKLALVTKVGGGNGLNLDPIPPKRPYDGTIGRAYLTIDPQHVDAEKVANGTFKDLTKGEYVTTPYRFVSFAARDAVPSVSLRLQVQDSVRGIWDAAATMVRALLAGEDVLIDLSHLRPEGASVNGSGGTSSGPSSFAVEIYENFARWAALGGAEHAGPVATLRYVFSNTLRSIRQGGTRRGAGMATLSVDHPDLMDFITAKDLERERAEGEIGTFNISVLANDAFMQAADGDGEAATVLSEIAQHAWQTGEPGLIYVDVLNEHSALARDGVYIVATNPCGEVPLTPGEPCDLGAINLAAYVRDGRLDRDALLRDAMLATRFLDDVLDAENAPLPEIHDAIADKRRLGLGIMGLAHMLIRMGLRYDRPEGRAAVADAISIIRNAAITESERLGAERGVPSGVERVGLQRRNIAMLTVAPTGTTSMLVGTSSGVEPVFAATIYRKIGTEYVSIIDPLFAELLDENDPDAFVRHGGSSTYVTTGDDGQRAWNHERIVEDLGQHHGSPLPLLGELPADPRLHAYLTAHDIAPDAHVQMQATVQRTFDWFSDDAWLDRDEDGKTLAGNSISKTINLPEQASVEDVLNAYALAWRAGCKGITVYRNNSRSCQVLTAGSGDSSAAASTDAAAETPVEPPASEPITGAPSRDAESASPLALQPRAARMRGITDQVRLTDGDGSKRGFFLTVNSNDVGEPREVFIISGKAGDEANGDSEALGRVVSIALQYGVPADALIKTLRGINGGLFGTYHGRIVHSKADLVAVALETAMRDNQREPAPTPAVAAVHEHVPDHVHASAAPVVAGPSLGSNGVASRSAKSCPHCGGELRRSEGCWSCSCGYSKCG